MEDLIGQISRPYRYDPAMDRAVPDEPGLTGALGSDLSGLIGAPASARERLGIGLPAITDEQRATDPILKREPFWKRVMLRSIDAVGDLAPVALARGAVEGFVSTAKRSMEEGDKFGRGEPFNPMPGLEAATYTLGSGAIAGLRGARAARMTRVAPGTRQLVRAEAAPEAALRGMTPDEQAVMLTLNGDVDGALKAVRQRLANMDTLRKTGQFSPTEVDNMVEDLLDTETRLSDLAQRGAVPARPAIARAEGDVGDFLDYSKPLSEQTPNVRAALVAASKGTLEGDMRRMLLDRMSKGRPATTVWDPPQGVQQGPLESTPGATYPDLPPGGYAVGMPEKGAPRRPATAPPQAPETGDLEIPFTDTPEQLAPWRRMMSGEPPPTLSGAGGASRAQYNAAREWRAELMQSGGSEEAIAVLDDWIKRMESGEAGNLFNPTGKDLYRQIDRSGSGRGAAADRLREAGVKGVRYGGEEGDNLVIFGSGADDNTLLRMIDRYGLRAITRSGAGVGSEPLPPARPGDLA